MTGDGLSRELERAAQEERDWRPLEKGRKDEADWVVYIGATQGVFKIEVTNSNGNTLTGYSDSVYVPRTGIHPEDRQGIEQVLEPLARKLNADLN